MRQLLGHGLLRGQVGLPGDHDALGLGGAGAVQDNDRLDERIAVAEAQEKAKTKAAKKEGKTGKSTKRTTKKAA